LGGVFAARLKARPFKALFFESSELRILKNLVKTLEVVFWGQVIDSVREIVRAIMSLLGYAI
jgi:hypothetical protein